MVRRLVVVVGIAVGSPVALADPIGDDTTVVTGDVIATTSRWTADGNRIVTEAQIRTANGRVTAVSQLGGHVGDLTMRTLPGAPALATGMTVEVVVRPARTGAGVRTLAVEDVGILRDDFVRTGPTPSGNYLSWASGCVKMGYGSEGTIAISGEDEFAAIEDCMAAWNDATAGCSYMDFVSEGPLTDHEVGADRVNIIKFRDATWCRPAVDDDPARCYSPVTAAITTVVYVDDADSDRDGEIIDADVEMNGVDFQISIDGTTLASGTCKAELKNTLTHELGHALGLEHTCRVAGDEPRVDDHGDAVPMCNDVVQGSEITEATMYNFQACDETKKESLSQDDIDAVCAVYPIADDPHECRSPGDSGGCSCDAGSAPAGPALLALLVGLALCRRRPRDLG